MKSAEILAAVEQGFVRITDMKPIWESPSNDAISSRSAPTSQRRRS